jgi:pyrimidine operon attenuation protein/uracil phosphoribosyltransferase
LLPEVLYDKESVAQAISKLARDILARNPKARKVALVGVKTRGVHLAGRIRAQLKKETKVTTPLGAMDTTLYRDDLNDVAHQHAVKGTEIPFDVNDMVIILVDDVLYTGRSVRAAIDQIIDFGRPKRIELAVLVDRGHRELPIAPDYVGYTIATESDDVVKVHLTEVDKRDEVVVTKHKK